MLGGGNGNPLQYSCLENSMDRGAWWVTVHTAPDSDATERLSLSSTIGDVTGVKDPQISTCIFKKLILSSHSRS